MGTSAKHPLNKGFIRYFSRIIVGPVRGNLFLPNGKMYLTYLLSCGRNVK